MRAERARCSSARVASFAFRVVWNFVSPMLDARIRGAIKILGGPSSYLPILLEYVDKADLPDFMGGTDKTMDFINESGPWAEHLPKLF